MDTKRWLKHNLIVKISNDRALNETNKVNLPQSFLLELLDYSDMYTDTNTNTNTHTNSKSGFFFKIFSERVLFPFIFTSVLEFKSHPSTIEIPFYMAKSHGIKQNDEISILLVPKLLFCHFLEIEPNEEDFFTMNENIENVLQEELSKIAVFYQKQTIFLFRNEACYSIKITKIEPNYDIINWADFTADNLHCFCSINQNLNVDIINKFQMQRYYIEKKRDKQREKMETCNMKREDFDIKINENCKSVNEIRNARIRKLKQNKN